VSSTAPPGTLVETGPAEGMCTCNPEASARQQVGLDARMSGPGSVGSKNTRTSRGDGSEILVCIIVTSSQVHALE